MWDVLIANVLAKNIQIKITASRYTFLSANGSLSDGGHLLDVHWVLTAIQPYPISLEQ